MANTIVTPTIFAREAVMQLEQACVSSKLVYRDYESEFNKSVNGYQVGATISLKRPMDFTVRDGRTASIQDITEGSIPFTVNKFKGIDFKLTTQELTQNIDDLSERVIKPGMIQLANQIDRDVFANYFKVNNWVGATTTTVIDSYNEFVKGPARLDITAVPDDMRAAVLDVDNTYGMLGTQTALFIQEAARGAYRDGRLGEVGGIDTYRSNNLATHSRATATTATAHGNTT